MDTIGFEQALVGTVITYPETFNDLEVTILPSDFEAISHQIMWEKVSALSASTQLSKVAIVETLRSLGLLENLGQDVGNITGQSYADYICSMSSPSSTGYYANQVVDASIRRQLNQSVALTKIEIAENKPAEELLDSAEARLWEMRRQKSPKGAEMRDLLEILDTTIDDYRSGKRLPAYTPKNVDLRKMLDHLEDQDLLIIGARPGEGKSSLIRSEAFLTAQDGTPVCIINMDNGEIDYPRYLIAFMTGINSKKLRNPKLMTTEEVGRAKAAIQDLKNLPIRIVTMGSPTVEMVLAAMKKAAVDGSKIFFIDYVQQIQNAGMANDPVQNISYSSNKLRGFNMKWRLPVIVASQFNREITHRGNEAEPTLSDFKGSGSLEQDATMAVAIRLLDWDENILKRFPENLVTNRGQQFLADPYDRRVAGVKFYVLKNRNGATGKSKEIKWDKSTNTYSPLSVAPEITF